MDALKRKSGLGISPGNITFDRVDEDASTMVTLENFGERTVRYKIRTPESKVITVAEPTGLIPTGSKLEKKVNYHSTENTLQESFVTAQVKSICLEDGIEDTDDIFEKHKANVQTAYLRITFQDQIEMEDAMFKTPKSSEKWWRKGP